MTSKSYSKDDLKRLMQERKEEQSKKKRIDSPLAGYDTDGNLYCKICEFKIENVNLWTRHLVSKEHKLSLEKIKRKGQIVERQPEQLNDEIKKRKLTDDRTGDDLNKNKQQKTESSSNSEKDDEVNSSEEQKTVKSDQANGDLPKGFFDNAEEDAKARDEIYKNPMDEEWSKFQRTMQEENKIVDNLTETDLVETQNYRDLIEIDEQIEHWDRINKLEIKRDAKKSNRKTIAVEHVEIDEDDDVDDDDGSDLEQEFNILSNWRCKKA